jgi:hypothetical protein
MVNAHRFPVGMKALVDYVRCAFFGRYSHSRMPLVPTHARFKLEASRRVNGFPLGCPLILPVGTVNCIQTLKGHSLGLKVGTYLNNCICMEGAKDGQHYEQDVAWMMEAGFDGVKIDNCGQSHNVYAARRSTTSTPGGRFFSTVFLFFRLKMHFCSHVCLDLNPEESRAYACDPIVYLPGVHPLTVVT